MKSQKNSFIFLETVFSILILSSLVAILINVEYTKEEQLLQLNPIENQFILKDYNQYFSQQNALLHFIKNKNENYDITVTKTTFNNSKIKLIEYAK